MMTKEKFHVEVFLFIRQTQCVEESPLDEDRRGDSGYVDGHMVGQ